MKNAPFSLDAAYPTLVHVVSDPEGSVTVGYDVECDVQVWRSDQNERRWRVQLGVKFKAKNSVVAAHHGEITYVGIFTVIEGYPEEAMNRLIGVNAPSILYSSIRELVALLTGRSSTKAVLLPTVSFIENVVVSPTEEEKEAARTATSATATRTQQKAGSSRAGSKSKSKTRRPKNVSAKQRKELAHNAPVRRASSKFRE
jgi:preprotein translocase subunit SecB